ncbi:hypothetical protein KJ942_06650 [bacterium]|jgi:hypothetical protein|nr:hypothetical protein [bacterium]MBU4024163.1 hypothetical protein [bacterium]MBU4058655.1 hypothetical protein [bacterium]MBU4110278.1 hypothetical protein [bacterium]
MLKIYFNDDLEDTDEDEYYEGDDIYADEEDLDEDEFYELDDEEEEEDSYCD